MKVTEIAFTGYPVTDIESARKFYGETLGLVSSMDQELEGMPGKYWIEYEIGTGTLAISNMWEPSGKDGPSIALEVEDFDQAVSELKAAGVEFIADRMESSVCCFALINDPDGNGITIHKRKS